MQKVDNNGLELGRAGGGQYHNGFKIILKLNLNLNVSWNLTFQYGPVIKFLSHGINVCSVKKHTKCSFFFGTDVSLIYSVPFAVTIDMMIF